MKNADGHFRIIWPAAAALVFGCSLITGAVPQSADRGSADLAAFLPPSSTPFLPDFYTRTPTPPAVPDDPLTATFTIAIVFSETVTPTSTPTNTLMMFPSQTPTATVTIYVLPSVTPTGARSSYASPTRTRTPYPSALPTVRLADPPSSTPLPSVTPLGAGDQPTLTPTGTSLPAVTATGQSLATATVLPSPTATVILQPTATRTPVPTSSSGCVVYNTDYESQTASLLNAQRTANGLPPLSVNGALTNSARGHSIDMVTHNLTQHEGSDGSTSRQRMTQAGYGGSWWGEIIYWGSGSYGTPAQAVTWWMNDPPHKDIILNTHYTDFGVGYVSCSSFAYKGFFTVDFGGP